jgi:hypothetical protein
MKAYVNVSLENGVLSVESNMGNAECIGILEVAKANVVRDSLGGVGRPPTDPASPTSRSTRAPGLNVRKVDEGT